MGPQSSPAVQRRGKLWPLHVKSLGMEVLKQCSCEPLGVAKGLMEVSRRCRSRDDYSDNGYLSHKKFFFVCFFRDATTAYVNSQARGGIRAAATNLHHSHSNMESRLHL